MSKIVLAQELLNDGKWHGKKELQKTLMLNSVEVDKMTMFLEKFGLARMDSKGLKVKYNKKFLDLNCILI